MSDFTNRYKNQKIKIPKGTGKDEKSISIAEFWLDHPDRRQYNGIEFSPGPGGKIEHIPGYYNLFRGYSIEPKPGDWPFMHDHIKYVIANGNQEHFNWLMGWLARIIQDPGGNRPGTSIVLRGGQGTGKGCFAVNFSKIFGNHFLHISNPNLILGRFNNHLKDCLVAFFDEAFWAGNKDATGVIKTLITEDALMIEPKGKDAFPVQNRVNLIIASNNSWVVPAGLDDRRFFVLDVSPKKRGNRKYFNALYREMENGGREAMLHDLLQFDISNVDLRTIPRTQALLDQIIANMESVESWWYDCLHRGSILKKNSATEEIDSWPEKAEKQLVYESYLEHANNKRSRNNEGEAQLHKKLRQLCPEIKETRPKKKNSKKRPRYYNFPDLGRCRELFEGKIEILVNWEDEEDSIAVI